MINKFEKSILEIQNKNALLIILFLYEYGLTIPFSFFIEEQVSITLATILLVISALYINKIRFSKNTIALFLIPFLLIIVKLPFEPYINDSVNIGEDVLFSFMTIGVCGILFGTLLFSNQKFIKYGLIIGWVNFSVICIIPFLSIYESIGYMRFGYGILPSAIFSFSALSKKENRITTLLLFCLSSAEMVIFGARGSTLTLLFFVIIYITLFSNKSKYAFFIILLILIFNFNFFIQCATNILFKHGIESYSVNKIIDFLNGNSILSTSSGRDVIYVSAIERIIDSPIMGSPFNTCWHDTQFDYYHNLFLDITVNFGIVTLIFFLSFLFYQIYRSMKSGDKLFQIVFLIIFIIPIGRLLISSTLWKRPDFWFFVSFCINHKYSIKK